jgi:hypothetical protein
MTDREDVTPPPVNAENRDVSAGRSLIDRLNKFKLQIAAIGGVVIIVITQLNTGLDQGTSLVKKLAAMFDKPAPGEVTEPCVIADKPTIPPVKSSEWDQTRFRLTGRNNCSFRQGVYVTFQRSQARDPRVRAPRFDREGCNRGEPVTKIECGWRREIPLEKGAWEIEVPLPPLERLNNAPPTETVLLVIEIRDLENPNKLPQWSKEAAIELRNEL